MILVPFLLMSTSLKKAPYVSWAFFLTVVPNLRSSSGTGCFAALRILIRLAAACKHHDDGPPEWTGRFEHLRSRVRLVMFGEQGDGLAPLAGPASSPYTVDIILDRERELGRVSVENPDH